MPDELPRFTIDLSLPPEQLYLEVCAALKDDITDLPSLFDKVVGGMVSWIPIPWLHFLCWLLLREVYGREENTGLKGISRATGISMYLLVCFNMLLDLFMGCSSGGARVGDGHGGEEMVHFGTLDWDIPALRRIVVQLDFIAETGGRIVVSSITYAGFVGVLTGVRKGFSVSLNSRSNRIENVSFLADAKHAWHLLMVLLAFRPSIPSILRGYILPRQDKRWFRAMQVKQPERYDQVVKRFRRDGLQKISESTGCYFCFCSGRETDVVEKDRITAKVRLSDDFIVVTHNDETAFNDAKSSKTSSSFAMSIADIVEEAKDRKRCAETNWQGLHTGIAGSRCHLGTNEETGASVTVADVVALVQMYPTTNEMTHLACVLDPSEGKVSWCPRWMNPVDSKWIKAHTPVYS